MKLDDLHPNPGTHRQKRRVGRGYGSGRGKTAGRGTKGQLARSGGGWNPRFEGGQTPIHLRLPHRRGFKNPFRVEYEIIKLQDLNQFDADTTINRGLLERAGLVHPNDERPLKLLANGAIEKALVIDGLSYTEAARIKIEEAGGSIIGAPARDTEPAGAETATDADA
ncbi:MAG: ribosomal protein [Chloroflexi bacterium]|nr:ribosomal protein [Chloroflexota bacterium]